MRETAQQLPDWIFEIQEVSAGCYLVSGKHKLGSRIEISGIDPDKLLSKVKIDARQMEAEIHKKLNSEC